MLTASLLDAKSIKKVVWSNHKSLICIHDTFGLIEFETLKLKLPFENRPDKEPKTRELEEDIDVEREHRLVTDENQEKRFG